MYKYFNFVFFHPTLQIIGVKRFADRLSIATFCIKIIWLFLYYITDNNYFGKNAKIFQYRHRRYGWLHGQESQNIVFTATLIASSVL